MSAANFPACLKHVLRFEGGYVDHPRDPGGATNMGITLATLSDWRGRKVSKREVAEITVKEASAIYSANYWRPVRGDNLPEGFDLVAFDGAVNSGPSRGAKWLQKGLGVPADGKIGPNTIAATVMVSSGVKVIKRACAARMAFLGGLGTWKSFGRGWSRRVAAVEAEAVAMYTREPEVLRDEAANAQKAQKAQTTGAATSVGGGGLAGLSDLSGPGLWIILAVVGVTAGFMILKAMRNKDRAEAYRQKETEHAR